MVLIFQYFGLELSFQINGVRRRRPIRLLDCHLLSRWQPLGLAMAPTPSEDDSGRVQRLPLDVTADALTAEATVALQDVWRNPTSLTPTAALIGDAHALLEGSRVSGRPAGTSDQLSLTQCAPLPVLNRWNSTRECRQSSPIQWQMTKTQKSIHKIIFFPFCS